MKITKILSVIIMASFVGLLYHCTEKGSEFSEKTASSYPTLASQIETSPGVFEILDKYLASSEFKEFLTKYHFKPTDYYRMMTNSNEEFFGVQVKHTNDETNIKDFFLIIYPTKLKFNVLIIEQEIGAEIAKLAIYHANDYKFLTSGDFSLNPTGNEAAVDRTCYSESSTFNECFGCSMAVLSSDPISTAACIVSPWSCVAAAVVHCYGLPY